MRNPIRLKNLRMRFAPFYAFGVFMLVFFPPRIPDFGWALLPISLGLALRGWGAGHLVKNEALTMTGPYAHLRHPLYAGTLLVAIGFAILLGGVVGLILMVMILPWFALGYFPRKDRIESARLESIYGQAYRTYHEAVPALWPRWVVRARGGSASGERSSAERWEIERYSENNELGTMLAVVAGVLIFWLRVQWAGP